MIRTKHFGLFLAILLLAGSGCQTSTEEATAPDWTVIGPGGGGSTFLPTISPIDPLTMLLRCDMTGGYLTRDGGQSWKMLNFAGGSQTFAFDPSNPDNMYIGARGLHGSTDGGETWQMLFPDPDAITEISHMGDHASVRYTTDDNFPDGGSVRAVWVNPRDSRHLMVAVSKPDPERSVTVIFESNDGGMSFQSREELEGSVVRLLYVSEPDPALLAFTRSAFYTFPVRGGDDAVRTELPEAATPAGWVDAGVNPDDGSMVFWLSSVGAGRFGASGRVFLSTDLGATWQQTGPKETPSTERSSYSHVATSAGDGRVAYIVCDASIETDADGKRGLWYGILKTADLGESWEWVYRAGGGSRGYSDRDGKTADNVDDSWVREAFGGEYIRMLHTGVAPTDPDVAIFTDWYRTMKTTDGGKTWQAVYSETLADGAIRSRGLDVTTTYGVHFDPFDPDHIAISYTDIAYWHSFDRGQTWRRPIEGVPPEWDNTCYWVQFDPEVKDRVWSVWSSMHDIPKLKMIRNARWPERAVGGVCVSDSGGRSWKVSSDGLPENSPTTSIELDPESSAGERTLYITVYGKGVYKSVDDGLSWTAKNAGLGENRNVWEIVRASDGTLYLVITHNTQFNEDGDVLPELQFGEVYKSTDGAENWSRVTLPDGVRLPNSLAVDEENPRRLLLACWGTLTRSDYARGEGGREEIETEGGVFRSDDGGETWVSVFDPSAYVYGVAIDSRHPGRLYLNTFHNDAWRSDNWGADWKRIKGYNFTWGHRPVIDPNDDEKIYLTTFGGSVMHGTPLTEE